MSVTISFPDLQRIVPHVNGHSGLCLCALRSIVPLCLRTHTMKFLVGAPGLAEKGVERTKSIISGKQCGLGDARSRTRGLEQRIQQAADGVCSQLCAHRSRKKASRSHH
jgi:hypothetical protein